MSENWACRGGEFLLLSFHQRRVASPDRVLVGVPVPAAVRGHILPRLLIDA